MIKNKITQQFFDVDFLLLLNNNKQIEREEPEENEYININEVVKVCNNMNINDPICIERSKQFIEAQNYYKLNIAPRLYEKALNDEFPRINKNNKNIDEDKFKKYISDPITSGVDMGFTAASDLFSGIYNHVTGELSKVYKATVKVASIINNVKEQIEPTKPGDNTNKKIDIGGYDPITDITSIKQYVSDMFTKVKKKFPIINDLKDIPDIKRSLNNPGSYIDEHILLDITENMYQAAINFNAINLKMPVSMVSELTNYIGLNPFYVVPYQVFKTEYKISKQLIYEYVKLFGILSFFIGLYSFLTISRNEYNIQQKTGYNPYHDHQARFDDIESKKFREMMSATNKKLYNKYDYSPNTVLSDGSLKIYLAKSNRYIIIPSDSYLYSLKPELQLETLPKDELDKEYAIMFRYYTRIQPNVMLISEAHIKPIQSYDVSSPQQYIDYIHQNQYLVKYPKSSIDITKYPVLIEMQVDEFIKNRYNFMIASVLVLITLAEYFRPDVIFFDVLDYFITLPFDFYNSFIGIFNYIRSFFKVDERKMIADFKDNKVQVYIDDIKKRVNSVSINLSKLSNDYIQYERNIYLFNIFKKYFENSRNIIYTVYLSKFDYDEYVHFSDILFKSKQYISIFEITEINKLNTVLFYEPIKGLFYKDSFSILDNLRDINIDTYVMSFRFYKIKDLTINLKLFEDIPYSDNISTQVEQFSFFLQTYFPRPIAYFLAYIKRLNKEKLKNIRIQKIETILLTSLQLFRNIINKEYDFRQMLYMTFYNIENSIIDNNSINYNLSREFRININDKIYNLNLKFLIVTSFQVYMRHTFYSKETVNIDGNLLKISKIFSSFIIPILPLVKKYKLNLLIIQSDYEYIQNKNNFGVFSDELLFFKRFDDIEYNEDSIVESSCWCAVALRGLNRILDFGDYFESFSIPLDYLNNIYKYFYPN